MHVMWRWASCSNSPVWTYSVNVDTQQRIIFRGLSHLGQEEPDATVLLRQTALQFHGCQHQTKAEYSTMKWKWFLMTKWFANTINFIQQNDNHRSFGTFWNWNPHCKHSTNHANWCISAFECLSHLPKQPVWNLYEVRRGKSKAPDRSPETQNAEEHTWIMSENYRAVDKNNKTIA